MRLKRAQKTKLLEWISEGLGSGEINVRASEFDPPFEVSRQQVDWYRATRALARAVVVGALEGDALTTGLALKSERVRRLQQLATLMEGDIFGGLLWTDQVKMIGSGPFSKEVDYEEFNGAEVVQYRGVLDDIAKELGERRTNSVNTNVQVDWDKVPPDIRDAFIDGKLSLDDVLRKHRTS